MALEAATLLGTMLGEAARVLGGLTPANRRVVESELRRIADRIVDIEARVASGELGEESAKRLIRMNARAAKQALVTGAGLGEAQAHKVVAAALASVHGPVKAALGWILV